MPYNPPPLVPPGPSYGPGLSALPVAPVVSTPPNPSAPSLPPPPPPTPTCDYPAVSGNWGVGCSGSIGAGTAALNASVAVNNTAPGFVGSISYRCEIPSGGGAPSMREVSRTCNPGASCSYAAIGLATGAPVAWQNGSGTASCAGTLPPPPAPGGSVTVNSTNGTPGSYQATCRADGSWDPNAVVTCDIPPDNRCAPRDVSWTVDGTQCSGRTEFTPFGQTVTVNSVNGNMGLARITCNAGAGAGAGAGAWGAYFAEECKPPVQPCAGGGTAAWGNCQGLMPASEQPHGAMWSAFNTQYGYTGSASLQCANGVWRQLTATCDAVPEAPSSPACSTGYETTMIWEKCTKKEAWTGGIQTCTPHGTCIDGSVTPPPGYTAENTFVITGVKWNDCPTDPRPWYPFPPERQAELDLENFQTRQTYCAD